MRRFFLDKQNIGEKLVEVNGDQFLHMTKVLRMNINDEFIAICGDNKEYHCVINKLNKENAVAEIIDVQISQTDAKTDVTVFQACVKGDKFDLIIQKLSELGITKIVPFDSEFAIAKCQKDKTQRYNKIAMEACKQCRRTVPLIVDDPCKFNDVLKKINDYDLVIFCNEHENSLSLKDVLNLNNFNNIAIIIGSEGGFSPKEIEQLSNSKAKSITLGKRILRAETASIATSACVMMLIGEME